MKHHASRPAAALAGLAAASLLFAGPASAQNLGTFGQRPGAAPGAPTPAPPQVIIRTVGPGAERGPSVPPQRVFENPRPVYQPPSMGLPPPPSMGLPPPGYGPSAPEVPAGPSSLYRHPVRPPEGTTAPSIGIITSNSPFRRVAPQSGPGRLPTHTINRPGVLPGAAGQSNTNYTLRVITPTGPRYLPPANNGGYLYGAPGGTIITNVPTLLGGYYYGGYCDNYYGAYTFPSVYSTYYGFPQYVYNPGVVVLGSPYVPVYSTPYLPFQAPVYQAQYNQYNYYVSNPQRAEDLQSGGERAEGALQHAYRADSYQVAFADIERAWTERNIALIRKHTRDTDTKLSVSLKGKYAYSIATGDFLQITRDALDRLSTVSFRFSRVRKAKNGDVTGYGKHVYRTGDAAGNTDAAPGSDTQPMDQPDDQAAPNGGSGAPAAGEEKAVYVSYTLRFDRDDDKWYIVALDSSPTPLIPSDSDVNAPAEVSQTDAHAVAPDTAAGVTLISAPARPTAAPRSRVYLSATKSGAYYLDAQKVAYAQILPQLKSRVRQNPHLMVVVSADSRLPARQRQKLLHLAQLAHPASLKVVKPVRVALQ